MFNNNYSPTQLLDVCTVKKTITNNSVADILAIVVTEKDVNVLKNKIKEKLQEIGTISIGMALQELHSIATIGPDLKGNLDGLDALTYHLSGFYCRQAIKDLQMVLHRFEETASIPGN
jgi:hypothetical protein